MVSSSYRILAVALALSLSSAIGAQGKNEAKSQFRSSDQKISLKELTVPVLRGRLFGSTLEYASRLGSDKGESSYSKAYSKDGSAPYNSYLAAYHSDGLRLYTRIDIPTSPPPSSGYPVLIFTHGYVGIEAAPTFHFSYTDKSIYAELIDAYVDAGFVVLTPGYRGHGVANGVPADGIDYMKEWDNGSYVSPIFYAIDVLNLLEGVQSIENVDWPGAQQPVAINQDKISLAGHSQGGDVALIVLAVAGEGSKVKNKINHASIWSGTFPDRMTQAMTYYPMQTTPEAFTSGDRNWNGTATGLDGSINPNFIFGYPSDWIETPNISNWTWQKKTWAHSTVAEALAVKFNEMYDALAKLTPDFDNPQFQISKNTERKTVVSHDPKVLALMQSLGAYRYAQYLTEPLNLHVPNQDFYSLPNWNEDLCERINGKGGKCQVFIYPQNNHSLRLSKHAWFSGPDAQEGYQQMIKRDFFHFCQ